MQPQCERSAPKTPGAKVEISPGSVPSAFEVKASSAHSASPIASSDGCAVDVEALRARHDAEELCGALAGFVGLAPSGARLRPSDLVAAFDWSHVSAPDIELRWDDDAQEYHQGEIARVSATPGWYHVQFEAIVLEGGGRTRCFHLSRYVAEKRVCWTTPSGQAALPGKEDQLKHTEKAPSSPASEHIQVPLPLNSSLYIGTHFTAI